LSISGKILSAGASTTAVRRTLNVSGLVAARMSTIAIATASATALMAMISDMY
jgi:hypothetical protein